MKVRVLFHSYFRELTGHGELERELPAGSTLADLVSSLQREFPRLKAMERSTLLAVGVEYQKGEYALREGDEVSLFPPVQGG
jgi:molybdopterin converting factor small subunit